MMKPKHGLSSIMWIMVTTLVIFSWLSSINSLRTYTKEYGESCNHLENCNYRHWIKCRNGICDCTYPDMLFTQSTKFLSFFSSRALLMERKSCRARVNFSCTKDHFVDDENNFISAPPLTKPQEWSTAKQTQLCVENSYCHPHGICKCHAHASLRPDGTCQKYREFSEQCDRDEACHPDHFLKCQQGICQCEPTLKYNSEVKKCTVAPGDKCKLYLSIRGKLIHNCVKNATCHLGECRCVRGYEIDYNVKVCSRQYGYFCNDVQPCDMEYQCVNSTCICNEWPNNPTHYDNKMKKCISQFHSIASSRILQLQLPFVNFVFTFLASCLF